MMQHPIAALIASSLDAVTTIACNREHFPRAALGVQALGSDTRMPL